MAEKTDSIEIAIRRRYRHFNETKIEAARWFIDKAITEKIAKCSPPPAEDSPESATYLVQFEAILTGFQKYCFGKAHSVNPEATGAELAFFAIKIACADVERFPVSFF